VQPWEVLGEQEWSLKDVVFLVGMGLDGGVGACPRGLTPTVGGSVDTVVHQTGTGGCMDPCETGPAWIQSVRRDATGLGSAWHVMLQSNATSEH
jgi:hypothetical protein